MGVGGDSGSILLYSRKLNTIFGFNWDIELRYLEEMVVCELSTSDEEGKVQTRSGMVDLPPKNWSRYNVSNGP